MALITDIKAYYKFEESSGNFSDEVASNDATPTGGTYQATGKIDNGYDLDTDGDYISFPKATGIGTGNFSISFWINWDKATGDALGQRLWMMKNSEVEAYIQVSDNKIVVFNDPSFTISSGTVADGSWTHIVMTWNGTNSNLYINGSLDANSPMTDASTATDIISTWFFGRSSGDIRHWTGVLDEMGMWAKELTSSEVTSLYNSGSGFAYPFSAGGTIAQSLSIDYNNGTVSTATLTSTEVSGSFDYEMTADGTNWETVTSGTAHTFTDTGTDLRWRATENAAAAGEISKIEVTDYH